MVLSNPRKRGRGNFTTTHDGYKLPSNEVGDLTIYAVAMRLGSSRRETRGDTNIWINGIAGTLPTRASSAVSDESTAGSDFPSPEIEDEDEDEDEEDDGYAGALTTVKSSPDRHKKSDKITKNQDQDGEIIRRRDLPAPSIFLSLLTLYLVINSSYLSHQLIYGLRTAIFVYNTFVGLLKIDKTKAHPNSYNLNYTRSSSAGCPVAITSWPEPPLDKFRNSTKIVWGYWHSGESNLRPISRIALQSWKAHHPDWDIVVLSDENYHQYVPSHHVPSTFDGLKVQHKSDLIRLSVLTRYGGAYFDMTSVIFRSLDGIWDEALKNENDNKLFVTSVLELNNEKPPKTSSQEQVARTSSLAIVNNAVLLSPKPNNPILVEFLRRSLKYAENPATSLEEFQSRPEFSRILPHIQSNSDLGMLGSESMVLYMAYLWIFTDLILYEEDFKAGEMVIDLPTLRWTFGFLVLPSVAQAFPSNEGSYSLYSILSSLLSRLHPSRNGPVSKVDSVRVHDWSLWKTVFRTSRMLRYTKYDDESLSSSFIDHISLIKSSADCFNKDLLHMSYEELLGQKTTIGRLYRAAITGRGKNATLEGSRPLGYGAEGCL